MKSFLRIGLAAVFLALFFNAMAVNEAKAQVIFEILKRMDAHQKSLVSLRSKVTMEKYNSQLKESDFNEGTAIYFRDFNRVFARVDWTKPTLETLAVANGQYVLYRPRLRQAIIGRISENNQALNSLSFLTMTKPELKANFNIKYFGDTEVVSGTQTARLEFTPKRPTIYKSAELWIDRTGMPIQVKVLEDNGDTTTVSLSDLKENVTISGAEFKVSLPKGTTVINFGGSDCADSPSSIDDALKNHSDVVFSGRIIAVNGSDYTFKTERMWKGTVRSKEIVRSLPTSDNPAIILAAGERYIVFAQNVQTQGKTVLGIMPCNLIGNILSVNGKKILTKLGQGKPISKTASKKKTPVKRFSKRPLRKRV